MFMAPLASAASGLIDDFRRDDLVSLLGTPWRAVSDQVMGGISTARIARRTHAGRSALCLSGQVSLENNGGFAQMNLALAAAGAFDARAFVGVHLVQCGNGATYHLHLKTEATVLPWQSYRATFVSTADWQEIRLPFTAFVPHRLDAPLALDRLLRLGVVAIGQAMTADLCLAEIGFYRAAPDTPGTDDGSATALPRNANP